MVQVITLPMDGGYKPRGNLAFEPYAVMVKRLGLPDARNKGPLSMIPESENEAHQQRQAAYWKAIAAEEAAKKVHTCDDWTFDIDEESPSEWCPACRHAAWLRQSKAGQQLIVDKYMAEHYPQPVKAPAPRLPVLAQVTPLQKAIIEGGGALGLMMRDTIINYMRPWYFYCEMDDKEWMNRKMPERQALPTMSQTAYMAALERIHGPVRQKAPREEAYVPAATAAAEPAFFNRVAAEPAFFNRVAAAPAAAPAPAAGAGGGGGAADAPIAALGGDEGKRMAAFAAWDAQDRESVRKPYHKGKMVAGNCRRPRREVSDAHKVVLRNLPLEVESLKADMWELVAQAGIVTDIYAPKGIYITMATVRDVDAVLARWPNGINYMGSIVTFERAGIARK